MKQASAGGPESGLSETNKHHQTLLLLLDHIVINTLYLYYNYTEHVQ